MEQWDAPWSHAGRRMYARRKAPLPFPTVRVFESWHWQDFYAVSLKRLANRFNKPYLTFFHLGQHLGAAIYPCLNKVRATRGWRDYRAASEEDGATTVKLLLQAAEHWPPNEWWSGSWSWEEMLKQLEKPDFEREQYDLLSISRVFLERALRESSPETPLFKPIQEEQGMFGLRAIVDPTGDYTVWVYRIGTPSNQKPILLTRQTARVVIKLIRETALAGIATKESLCRNNEPKPESLHHYVSMARAECFDLLGIIVKSVRDVGYQLAEAP